MVIFIARPSRSGCSREPRRVQSRRALSHDEHQKNKDHRSSSILKNLVSTAMILIIISSPSSSVSSLYQVYIKLVQSKSMITSARSAVLLSGITGMEEEGAGAGVGLKIVRGWGAGCARNCKKL